MKKWMIVCAASLLLISGHAEAQPAPAATIPSFEFTRFSGEKFTDKDLANTRFLFFCFFDITCSHCLHAVETINSNYSKFTQATIYMLTLDEEKGATAYLKLHAPNLLGAKNVVLLRDTNSQFVVRFNPKKYPSLFLYSGQRKLILYDDRPEKLKKFFEKMKPK